jgi:hypothetical protein
VFHSHSNPFEVIYLDELYWIRERRQACDPRSASGKTLRPKENEVLRGILAQNFTPDLHRQLAQLAGHAFRKIIVDSLSAQSLSKLNANERDNLSDIISRCILNGSQEKLNDAERQVFDGLAVKRLAQSSFLELSKRKRDALHSMTVNRLTRSSFAKLPDTDLAAFLPLIVGRLTRKSISDLSDSDLAELPRIAATLVFQKPAKQPNVRLTEDQIQALKQLKDEPLSKANLDDLKLAEFRELHPLIVDILTRELLCELSILELKAFQSLAQKAGSQLSPDQIPEAIFEELGALAETPLTYDSVLSMTDTRLDAFVFVVKNALADESLGKLVSEERSALRAIALTCLSGESLDRLPTGQSPALLRIVRRLFIEDSLSQLSIEDRKELSEFFKNRLTHSFRTELTATENELLDRLIIGRLSNGSTQRLAKIEGRVLEADLCGLAISGGGIRSATFALGVLQGLAITGLLPRFDYLSTVSGGGFIGAWFSTWVNRDGFQEVNDKLLPPVRQAVGPAAIVEAEPIRHLRLYSNYLAPRPGLFSFDGWVLIAIYLRNLLLNQSMLLLAVLSLFAGVRTFIELFPLVRELGSSPYDFDYNLLPFAILSIAAIGVALSGARSFAPGPRLNSTDGLKGERDWNFDLSEYWAHCVVPWLLAGFFTSLLFSAAYAADWFTYQSGTVRSPWAILNPFGFHPFAFHMCLAAVTFGLLHAVLGWIAFSCWREASGAGFLAGAIGGLAIFLGWSFLISLSHQIAIAIIVTLGVPMCLGAFVLTNFLMVGFCGAKLSELEREWWSSLNSRLMYLALAWLILFGTAIFGPWLLVFAWEFVSRSDRWLVKTAAGVVGSAWFGSLLGGLTAAKSSSTGNNRQAGLLNALAHIAPFLFAITLFLGASLFSTWVLYDVYYLLQMEAKATWLFENRGSLQLLTDLNEAHWLIRIYGIPISAAFFALFGASFLLAFLSYLLGKYVGVNTFSLQNLYANRLVRCYLGASKGKRNPDPIVNMDPNDDIPISMLFPGPNFQARQIWNEESNDNQTLDSGKDAWLKKRQRIKQDRPKCFRDRQGWGPIHIINGALNQKASVVRKRGEYASNEGATSEERQAENLQFVERQAESFIFTPLYSGSEATGYCPSYKFAGDVKLGAAVAVSGAAVSPNMGYHSSPAITALLTVFNIRLGAWFGNPRSPTRVEPNPAASAKLLLSELAGRTDAESDHVYISDGGHFENMGVYELIRRRCRFIVAVDAGADPKFHENVGRLVRQVRIDFGILLEIDMSTVTPATNGLSQSHIVVGRIHYGDVHKPKVHEQNPYDPRFSYDRNHGIIVWIKNSLTGDEPGDLVNHAAMHPTFPYDTTVDQFFDEPQFESYRALGVHSILMSLIFPCEQIRKCAPQTSPNRTSGRQAQSLNDLPTRDMFSAIYEHLLTAPTQYVTSYVDNNDKYAQIQMNLRTNPKLERLAIALYGSADEKQIQQAQQPNGVTFAERLMAGEMFSLLENVFLSLNLERNYLHPVHAGWMKVFVHWAKLPLLRSAWTGDANCDEAICHEFGPAFRRFIDMILNP